MKKLVVYIKKIAQDPTEILVEFSTDLLDWKLKYLGKKAKFLVATGYDSNEKDLVF